VIARSGGATSSAGTIQVVPHITNEIKDASPGWAADRRRRGDRRGRGTVGDIECLPFLEAIRQMHRELGSAQTLFIHVTLLPYVKPPRS